MILSAASLAGSSLLGLYDAGAYSVYGLKTLYRADGVRYRDYQTFTEATANLPSGAAARFSQNKIKGESVVFQGTPDSLEHEIQRLQVEVTARQTLGGIEIVYGFTEKLSGGVTIDGKRVNVQFAYRGGTVTVGSPVILGSY